MDILQSLALAGGMAWASGMRLYAVVFLAGLLERLGYLQLPETLSVLENPWIIGLSGVLLCIEFLADKVPAIDSFWDALQGFIRIPAGAHPAPACKTNANESTGTGTRTRTGPVMRTTTNPRSGARPQFRAGADPAGETRSQGGSRAGEDPGPGRIRGRLA